MNLRHFFVALSSVGLTALLTTGISGCNDKKAPPPPPPSAPKAPSPAQSSEPPPVVVQEPIQIGPVMASMKPDQRVIFPQDAAPTDEGIAKAIIKLASNLAKGDSDAIRPMLQDDAKTTLDGLVNSGDWDIATKRIEGVRIIKVDQSLAEAEPTTFTVQMAIQESGESYVIGWQGDKEGSAWKITGAKAPGGTKPRASDWADGSSEGASSASESASNALGQMDDQTVVLAALPIFLGEKTAQAMGTDMKTLMQQSGQSLPPGVDIDAIKSQAKAALNRGVMPEAKSFKMLVDMFKMQPGTTLESIFSGLAETTGVSADKWQALYDSAGGSSGAGKTGGS